MTAAAKHWPLAAALAVLAAALGIALAESCNRNDGHLIYVLDDPYIHMAVAKNLTGHGVFGATRYGYSSSTSSIAWPLLLAAVYWVTGPNALVPWVLNVMFAAAAVSLMYILLRRRGVPPGLNFLSLLIISFCTPLPAIIFTGMEHSLHVLLAVAWLYLAATLLTERPGREGASSRWSRALLFALSPLMTMTRYEGALMVAVVCLMFAIRRRIREALVLGLLGAAPVVLSGLVSIAHGWHFLPNPVLLKGRLASTTPLGEKAHWAAGVAWSLVRDPTTWIALAALLVFVVLYRRGRRPSAHRRPAIRLSPAMGLVLVAAAGSLLVIDVLASSKTMRWVYVHEIYLVPAGLLVTVSVLLMLYRKHGLRPTANKTMLWIFLATALLHLALARRGWFWRYEAYLVASGLFAILLVSYDEFLRGITPATLRRQVAWCAAMGFCAVPFAVRGVQSLAEIPRASHNIYQQQYQMASFLDRHYTGQGVAANDVGAINYYADVRCLDLWGLCDLEMASARLTSDCTPEEIHALAASKGVRIAIVFDKWCEEEFGGVPPQWEKVGQWEIVDNLVCGWYFVSFYAVVPREREKLAENLLEFSSQLPASVIQRGSYLESKQSSAPRTATRR